MDEIELTPRQRKILTILAQQPLAREAISVLLRDYYPVSKTTLYRELQALEQLQLVKISGVGKRTLYHSLENPLVRYIDLKEYFREESKFRQSVRESFNENIFNHLSTIVNNREITAAKTILKSLHTQAQNIDPTIFKREIERFTVEFSWKSSRIEGNTYSLLETELLIKQRKEAEGHAKYEATMILNHKDAVDYILSHRNEFLLLTVPKLQMIHTLISKDLNITPGIRKGEVAITGTNYLPPGNTHDIQNALEKTIQVINHVQFPLTKALITHAMIAYIQPFTDGNKRTARTITNAILVAHDLYPLSYRNLDELEYIQALLLFYEQNSLYHLKRIFMEQVRFSVENYFRT